MSKELTPKQERFCQKYHELSDASAAYRFAYEAENMADQTIWTNASVLLKNNKVANRVKELKEQANICHNITINDLIEQLLSVKDVALGAEKPQSAAAVSALMGVAKLKGFDIVKHEVTGAMTINRIERIVVDGWYTND